ncbi:DUF4236 domain-containing protein [Streptomyces beihaiensis]|uniref:DUF4236 domain-containing protein n=1 Tax=Streptomyces beihaiensis TaxID=2984495 RepID=A0ABT3TS20_9ACTN|nr:DUF4236 domain-containing protein [Streptomyces beihaiensis]MCX3059580.1 DUF4236 domain-containing protein [Streptomyces beihaiensis]
MAFLFRKSFRIAPGIRITLGRRSASVSAGAGPLRRAWSSTGRTTDTVSLPGGLRWRRSRRH